MEELLLRLVPNLADEWEGATEDEIAQIEQIAGRPLPRFYRWFLMRMGRNMGPVAYPTLDFSAAKVLSCYAERLFYPHPRFLMIGYESDEMMPLHMLYDFDFSVRDDARVCKRHYLGGAAYNRFETFREMIAWGEFVMSRIEKCQQWCRGLFVDPDKDVMSRLRPVMESLGFKAPISTGPFCAVYDSGDVGMASHASPDDEPAIHVFRMGGPDAGRLRRILGEIATETSLQVSVKEWSPPLA